MSWTDVASADEVSPGKVHAVEAGDVRVAICRTENALYAIEDVCTHDGSPLEQGELEGTDIECPRHGAHFDVTTGKAMTLPAVRPVRTFPVREQDGRIEVDLPS